jgi:hypothetical protein
MGSNCAFSSTISVLDKFFCTFLGGLECVGHSFAYVASPILYLFVRCLDSNQRAAAASRRALYTNLATHLLYAICLWLMIQ